MKCLATLGAPALWSFVLWSCTAAPVPWQAPELGVELPERWSLAAAKAEPVQPEWWRSFESPELASLIEEALQSNHDLAAAAARVESAVIQARIAGANLYPSLTASFNGDRQRQNFIGFPIPGAGRQILTRTFSRFGASLSTSWEIDLWGRVRAGQQAALASAQASAADWEAARESLAAQIARSYFADLEARLQVKLAQRTVQSYRQTLARVRDRFQRGVRPAVDLRLARNQLAAAKAQLAAREEQQSRTVRQLEALLGRYPNGALEAEHDLPALPGPVPAGLPAELLARRPDVVSAERALAEQTALVAQARAALYPQIALTANGGTAARKLENLIDSGFLVWDLMGELTEKLFDGGRLQGNVELAKANLRAAAASYANTALTAYTEVESSLVAEQILGRQQDSLERAAEEARAARGMSEDRYDRGLDDFLTVLEAQRREFDADSALLAVRRRRLDTRIDLHLALGGGFEPIEGKSKP